MVPRWGWGQRVLGRGRPLNKLKTGGKRMLGVPLIPSSPGLSVCDLRTMAIWFLHCHVSKKSRQPLLPPHNYSPIHASLRRTLDSTPTCAPPRLSTFPSPVGPLASYQLTTAAPSLAPILWVSGSLQSHWAIRTPINASVTSCSPPVSNFFFWEISSKP